MQKWLKWREPAEHSDEWEKILLEGWSLKTVNP